MAPVVSKIYTDLGMVLRDKIIFVDVGNDERIDNIMAETLTTVHHGQCAATMPQRCHRTDKARQPAW